MKIGFNKGREIQPHSNSYSELLNLRQRGEDGQS